VLQQRRKHYLNKYKENLYHCLQGCDAMNFGKSPHKNNPYWPKEQASKEGVFENMSHEVILAIK
jgi:hypothetical protein